MLDNLALRREYVLDQAMAAGKFGPQRRSFWSSQYNRDPAGTERTLAALASAMEGAPPYPREILFPQASQRRRPPMRSASVAATAPPPPPPSAEVVDEEVKRWTEQLFPETRAAAGRVVRAND